VLLQTLGQVLKIRVGSVVHAQGSGSGVRPRGRTRATGSGPCLRLPARPAAVTRSARSDEHGSVGLPPANGRPSPRSPVLGAGHLPRSGDQRTATAVISAIRPQVNRHPTAHAVGGPVPGPPPGSTARNTLAGVRSATAKSRVATRRSSRAADQLAASTADSSLRKRLGRAC
jgi:hypothetical protein